MPDGLGLRRGASAEQQVSLIEWLPCIRMVSDDLMDSLWLEGASTFFPGGYLHANQDDDLCQDMEVEAAEVWASGKDMFCSSSSPMLTGPDDQHLQVRLPSACLLSSPD